MQLRCVGCAFRKVLNKYFNPIHESGGKEMITLKKSFEVQNYLSQLLNNALNVLAYNDNITTTKQKHLRKKSYSEAVDEEIIVKKTQELPYTINQLIKFIDIVIAEMDKLTTAINDAKHYEGEYFDAMIAINNKKRNVLRRYDIMAQLKPSETVVKGTGEKFNEAGEQVTYKYDIEQVTTIDFDRNIIKKKVSQLRKELDETSDAIDAMQLSSMVDYDPIFEIGESLEDVVERIQV